jgi:hypothetical protein
MLSDTQAKKVVLTGCTLMKCGGFSCTEYWLPLSEFWNRDLSWGFSTRKLKIIQAGIFMRHLCLAIWHCHIAFRWQGHSTVAPHTTPHLSPSVLLLEIYIKRLAVLFFYFISSSFRLSSDSQQNHHSFLLPTRCLINLSPLFKKNILDQSVFVYLLTYSLHGAESFFEN